MTGGRWSDRRKLVVGAIRLPNVGVGAVNGRLPRMGVQGLDDSLALRDPGKEWQGVVYAWK